MKINTTSTIIKEVVLSECCPLANTIMKRNAIMKRNTTPEDNTFNNPSIITRINMNYTNPVGDTPPTIYVIDKCIEDEETALIKYTKALTNKTLTDTTKLTIRTHIDLILTNIELLKSMKNSLPTSKVA